MVLASCVTTSTATPAPSSQDKKYGDPSIKIILDHHIFKLHEFIRGHWQEIMADLKLPKTTKPPAIQIVTSFGPTLPNGFIILGDYNMDTDTIRIYWRFPEHNTCEFSLSVKSMVHTFLHEILHYYDDIVGTIEQTPDDHNALFDKRIIDLKWDVKFISQFI